jgi:hypothetical protein
MEIRYQPFLSDLGTKRKYVVCFMLWPKGKGFPVWN